jgi:hypothetical protein
MNATRDGVFKEGPREIEDSIRALRLYGVERLLGCWETRNTSASSLIVI